MDIDSATTGTVISATAWNSTFASMVSCTNDGTQDYAVYGVNCGNLTANGSVALKGNTKFVGVVSGNIVPVSATAYNLGYSTAFSKIYINGCVSPSQTPALPSVYGNNQILAYGKAQLTGEPQAVTSTYNSVFNCTMTSQASGQIQVTFLNGPYDDKYAVVVSPVYSRVIDSDFTFIDEIYYPANRVHSVTTAGFTIYNDAIRIFRTTTTVYESYPGSFRFVVFGGRDNPTGTP